MFKLALSLHKDGAIFELYNFLERLYMNGRIRQQRWWVVKSGKFNNGAINEGTVVGS